MESNSNTDLKSVSTSADSGSSDLDEDDDAFFNELFTGSAPSYEYEAAEKAPWLDDSDTEISDDTMVKFYIHDSMAVAEIAGTRHQIGFMDLTDEEHSCLGAISETTVEMSVNEKFIMMQNQKFNIKRIQEYENTVGSHQKQMETLFEELSLHRIQFSSSEPFLAKYQNDIYFVGKRLCVEYLLLLNRTKQQPGTSIRISKKRLTVDRLSRVLDVKQAIDFKKPNEICIIADTNESSTATPTDNVRPKNSYRRFVMSPSTWTLLEVEANLIHSSIYDVCTEIYAELNFPFTEPKPKPKAEEIVPPTEKQSRTERKRERALKHEEKMKQNEKKKQNESTKNLSKSSSFSSPEVVTKGNVEKKNEAQSGKSMRTLVFSNSSNARNDPVRSENNGPFQMEDLKPYVVSDDVKEYLKTGTPLSCVDRTSAMTDKNPENRMVNFLIASDLMVELEEAEHARYLEKFVQKNVRLTYCGDNQFSFSLTDEMGEMVAEIENNSIQFVILRATSSSATSNQKEGKICGLQDRKVLFDVTKTKSFDLIRGSCENELFDISFKLNRLSYKLQHYALEFVLDHELFVRLVDNSDYRSSKPPESKRVGAKANRLRNTDGTQLKQLNGEQYSAVINILFSSKTHLPYLLIGPPGTGKTHTLVALIEQIVRTTNQNVLFCAPTHNACDEMVYHLTRVLQAGEMYRFYATSSKHSKTKPQVLEVSNFNGTAVSYPPLNTLYKYRVVICTLESAGFLTRARIDKDWNGQNFKYVIIDDSASAHETMTFIPIAGLCTSKKKLHAKIILSGDSKLLSPATRSNMRIEMGYNKSWLAHLCRTKLYSRNEESGKFNDSFVTYLNRNYRSHPQILHIPNELFYENAMQSSAKIDDVGWYLNTSLLPSKQFPFNFMAVQGSCQRAIGYNWTNDAEVDEVVSIVKRLLPPNSKTEGLKRIAQWQIGVVTPFCAQNCKIVQALQALNLGKVDVGTAESFQGKEKPVMIISTVRSASEPFSFDVTDSEIIECVAPFAKSEWLNTVINRGKCLVIVIGDPKMLRENTKWKWLIERCIHHGSFQGDCLTFYSENIQE